MRIWQLLPALFDSLGFFSEQTREELLSSVPYQEYLAQGHSPNQLPDLTFLDAAENQATLKQLRKRLAGKKRLCLVLIDGMGLNNLQQRRGHIPFLRRVIDEQNEDLSLWRTCMPSTTVAALTSLHTGVKPGIHGMTGYQAWDHRNGQVLNLINFRAQKEVSAQEWTQQPSFFQLLTALGRKHFALGPKKFAGSKLSSISLRGANFVGVDETAARFAQVPRLFSAEKADYVYCYSADLDHAGHHHGWESPEWISALEETDYLIKELAQRLPEDVALVVTADHGMISRGESLDLAKCAELAKMVKIVSGEPRCLQVHLRSEVKTRYLNSDLDKQALLATWQNALVGKAQLVSDYREIYGECLVPERMGELILLAKENYQVVDSRFHPAPMREMPGIHGSDTAMELEIPCLIPRSS